MTYIKAIILGLVQGLTEFLPVSSSGHLLILQYFFGIEGDSVLIFTIMMHIGTLVSVFFCFYKDIWELIKELGLTIKDIVTLQGLKLDERPMRRMGLMIIVACIPTALIGLGFEDMFESFYESLLPTAIGLLVTGCLLWLSECKKFRKNKTTASKMEWTHAIIIGTMQGIAICPGISRSGSTLSGGIFTGLERNYAVEFAFLISIPTILGSLIMELDSDALSTAAAGGMGPIIVGGIVAAASGILAIKAMITVVKKLSLRYFSAYVWALGLFLIIFTKIAA